jgi:hypothetical protein
MGWESQRIGGNMRQRSRRPLAGAGLARRARIAGRVGSFIFASRACRAHNLQTIYEECGFFEGVEQLLGNFQVTSSRTDFNVRFGDAVEIASTSH